MKTIRIKKVLAAVLAAMGLCLGFSVSVYAETPLSIGLVVPLYETAINPMVTLSINDTTATCTSTTSGNDCTSITVTQTLQKHWLLWIWIDVDGAEWSKTIYDSSLLLPKSKSGLTNGTYRVKSVFTLTNKQDETETVTVYSSEKKVG